MSRIGKKPIPVPKGVTVKVEATRLRCRGEGQTGYRAARAFTVHRRTESSSRSSRNDSQAALHGLARALVNNASRA